MSAKRFSQNWDAPAVYKDLLVAIVEEYKPSAAVLKKIVDDMTKRGYKFTFRGLEHSWDAQSNQDLLIAMYETLSPGAEQIRCIVERTKAMGYTFTAKAVHQHLQKLRRAPGSTSSDANSAPTTPKTPRVAKTPRSKGTPKTGTKRKNAKCGDEGERGDYCDVDTPTKKIKKAEDNDDDLAVKNEFLLESDTSGNV